MQLTAPQKEGQKSQIFIVEDETIIAGLLADVILDLGYQYVGPAYDLGTALLIAENPSKHIDAALVDITLGSEQAYKLCHALENRSVPFAFATGMEGDMIEEPWRKCHHLAKPFTRIDIAAALATLLSERDRMIESGLETP
jgi:DNA-binding response OmpR family regulator